MTWLFVAILAYFVLAIAALIDKYLISGPIPNPQVYAFYVGILGIVTLFLAPFGFLKIPSTSILFIALSAGAFNMLALWMYFRGLRRLDASRIIPAIGGFLPIFTLGLTFAFSKGKAALSSFAILAFLLLVSGSVVISLKKGKKVSMSCLPIASLSAFLFGLYFALSKFVYLSQPFISGFIWTRIGAFLVAFFLFFSKEVRQEVFEKRRVFQKKTLAILAADQTIGGGGFLLQNWAVALAPLSYVAFVNALQGFQYIFLLIFALIVSIKFPKVLREEVSKSALLQKVIAILLISAGLVILYLKQKV